MLGASFENHRDRRQVFLHCNEFVRVIHKSEVTGPIEQVLKFEATFGPLRRMFGSRERTLGPSHNFWVDSPCCGVIDVQ